VGTPLSPSSSAADGQPPREAAACRVRRYRRPRRISHARDIRKRGWWSAYGDVLTGSFAELEDDASHIQSWQTQVIPGLLQTEGYARTLIAEDTHDETQDERVLGQPHLFPRPGTSTQAIAHAECPAGSDGLSKGRGVICFRAP
jgi:Domain of unknown function (DUF5753)